MGTGWTNLGKLPEITDATGKVREMVERWYTLEFSKPTQRRTTTSTDKHLKTINIFKMSNKA
jgi:hypothetical protein